MSRSSGHATSTSTLEVPQGYLANSMLVMVDGRSFFQPLYGAVYWDLMTVTAEEIGHIEVLRSPASAVWGANALTGVINIRTKSPRQMEGLRGHLGFGERGTKTAGMIWADSTDRLSYKLSGSYFDRNLGNGTICFRTEARCRQPRSLKTAAPSNRSSTCASTGMAIEAACGRCAVALPVPTASFILLWPL